MTASSEDARRRPKALFVGLATLALTYRVADFPAPDEKIVALSQELCAGGPAANAAVTFAALGGKVTLLTALGNHILAQQVKHDLEKHGVELYDAYDGEDLPPVASCYIKDSTGERCVVSVGAAASEVSVSPRTVAHLLEGINVVLFDGHHPRLALAVVEGIRTQRLDIRVVIDAGSWKPVFRELFLVATDIIASARFRHPAASTSESSHLATLVAIAEQSNGRLICAAMTNGSSDIVALDDWQNGRTTSYPVPQVQAKDTLGAGDVFHGAYAYVIAAGPKTLNRKELFWRASCVAAIKCSMVGQRIWLSSAALTDLKRRLQGSQ